MLLHYLAAAPRWGEGRGILAWVQPRRFTSLYTTRRIYLAIISIIHMPRVLSCRSTRKRGMARRPPCEDQHSGNGIQWRDIRLSPPRPPPVRIVRPVISSSKVNAKGIDNKRYSTSIQSIVRSFHFRRIRGGSRALEIVDSNPVRRRCRLDPEPVVGRVDTRPPAWIHGSLSATTRADVLLVP